MSRQQFEPIEFVAWLVFHSGEGRRCVAPFVCSATHPEIAFQLAIRRGNRERYGMRFAGLGALAVKNFEVHGIARDEKGDASELIVEKESLAAFGDTRWSGVPCDLAELEIALQEPASLFDVPGIEDVAWQDYEHAYAIATDIPRELRGLVSSDASRRKGALDYLHASIHHQEDLCSATAATLPFLIRIAANEIYPDRRALMELVQSIAESARIRGYVKAREEHRGLYARLYPDVDFDNFVREKVDIKLAVQNALRACENDVRKLTTDSLKEVADLANSILKEIENY